MIKIPMCLLCKHFTGQGKCKAFPDGIPDQILDSKIGHVKPLADDNGIQFEASDTSDKAHVKAILEYWG